MRVQPTVSFKGYLGIPQKDSGKKYVNTDEITKIGWENGDRVIRYFEIDDNDELAERKYTIGSGCCTQQYISALAAYTAACANPDIYIDL